MVRYNFHTSLEVPQPLLPGMEVELQNKLALCVAEHLESLGLDFTGLSTECAVQDRFLPDDLRNRMQRAASTLQI